MRRAASLCVLLVVGVVSIVVSAQPGTAPMTLEQLEDDLYVLNGGCMCGNTAAYVTDGGVVLVDTKVAGQGEAILEQLRTVTDQPITTIINTHTHFDHTGANAEFGTIDQIVTHANAQASLSQESCAPVTNCDAFKGENARFLPNVTFEDTLTLTVGSKTIDLYYFGPGHTNGDAWIVFPEIGVAHGGDLFGAKGAPFIDTENGGTAIGYDDTIARAVAGLQGVDTVISGHVAAYPFDDLVRYAEFHRHLEAHVLAGRDAGMTVEEIVGAYSQPADLQDFSFIEPFATNFVQLLYDEAGADRNAADATQQSPLPHAVRTTKFTIDDVDASTAFYEDLLGMTEVGRFVDEGRLVEPFMGFADGGGRVGLLGYTEKEGLAKSQYPVSVLTVPDLDPIVARFEAAAHPIFQMSAEETGSVRLVIARDPSGNAIEIIEVPGPATVGGARLVVDDRQAAEDFFVQIFGVSPGQRIVTDTFDEVFMEFGDGMFVALIEPSDETPLPKSRNPVVAIYSTQFDAVLERVKAEGHSVREFSDSMFLVDDPSGNVVEVVRQRP